MHYIIKIKGKVNIPDYVQLRDEHFTLLVYFRADRPEKALRRAGFELKLELIKKILDEIPFGKLHPIELDNNEK
ncbi:MAG: fructose-6-phosphate aldolase [Bacteroidetes bacterium]|nr:fructose-6-phosphate aldolase [Bacteroidota bacterium]